jgi:hypothetical protein
MAFFPHEPEFLESTKQKEDYVKILSDLKKNFYDKNVELSIFWVNTIEHGSRMIQDFLIPDFFPSVIALSNSHYSISRYAFELSSLSDFVTNFKAGKGKVSISSPPILDKIIRTEL